MLRLVTANVQHALSKAVGAPRADVPRLAAALAALDPDVVALQEVDRGQERSGGRDQAAEVAAVLGMPARRFAPALRGQVHDGARRRRARGDEPASAAAYGIAVLSRHPVTMWRADRLPGLNVPGLPPLGVDEPRVALSARIDTPDGALTVVTTHLSRRRPWKQWQLLDLRRRLRAAPRPLVLLGDLNLRGDAPARLTGWRELVHVPAYPAGRPWLRIDHVLVDGAVRAAGPARAVDLGVSDHRAVVVDVLLGSVDGTGKGDDDGRRGRDRHGDRGGEPRRAEDDRGEGTT